MTKLSDCYRMHMFCSVLLSFENGCWQASPTRIESCLSPGKLLAQTHHGRITVFSFDLDLFTTCRWPPVDRYIDSTAATPSYLRLFGNLVSFPWSVSSIFHFKHVLHFFFLTIDTYAFFLLSDLHFFFQLDILYIGYDDNSYTS